MRGGSPGPSVGLSLADISCVTTRGLVNLSEPYGIVGEFGELMPQRGLAGADYIVTVQ